VADQICPACFRLIPAEAGVCPACGADLVALSARDYREKLLAALQHPLDDVRMRAILVLGLRGESDAADALVECALRHPIDVVEGLAVVGTLTRLGAVGRAALLKLAECDPAHAVREAARRAVDGHQGESDA
jgi:HEAT repeat protein